MDVVKISTFLVFLASGGVSLLYPPRRCFMLSSNILRVECEVPEGKRLSSAPMLRSFDFENVS